MAALTTGVHHIGLTVRDVRETGRFFTDVLGFKQVGEKPDYPAVFVSDDVVMLTLWQAQDPDTTRTFDRKNTVGLHHLALRLPDHDALDALHAVLSAHEGVRIDFPPEALGTGVLRHMMCFIPGGIRVEFISAGSQVRS